MEVVVVEVARVEVSPTSRSVIEGESFTATADLRGPGGESLTGRVVTWTTSASGVVAVSGSGSQVTVTGLAPGDAVVSASAEGRSAAIDVEVLEGPSLILAYADLVLQGIRGEVAGAVEVGVGNGGNGEISGLSTQVTYLQGTPAGWLSVGLNGTTVPTSLTLVASAVGLEPGIYTASVRVSSPAAGGLTADLPVRFEVVLPPPTIVLEVPGVGLLANVGSPFPAVADVDVTNGGGGDLTGLSARVVYPTGGREGWLGAVLSDSRAPATLTVSASATGLPAGTYTARVAVTSPVARVSPIFLDVTFRVAAPGGAPGP